MTLVQFRHSPLFFLFFKSLGWRIIKKKKKAESGWVGGWICFLVDTNSEQTIFIHQFQHTVHGCTFSRNPFIFHFFLKSLSYQIFTNRKQFFPLFFSIHTCSSKRPVLHVSHTPYLFLSSPPVFPLKYLLQICVFVCLVHFLTIYFC
jgi:hypothetical protein